MKRSLAAPRKLKERKKANPCGHAPTLRRKSQVRLCGPAWNRNCKGTRLVQSELLRGLDIPHRYHSETCANHCHPSASTAFHYHELAPNPNLTAITPTCLEHHTDLAALCECSEKLSLVKRRRKHEQGPGGKELREAMEQRDFHGSSTLRV